jgi:hypothetical protein
MTASRLGTTLRGKRWWCSRALEVLVCAHAHARVRELAEHARRQSVHETQEAFAARHLQTHRPECVRLRTRGYERRSHSLCETRARTLCS